MPCPSEEVKQAPKSDVLFVEPEAYVQPNTVVADQPLSSQFLRPLQTTLAPSALHSNSDALLTLELCAGSAGVSCELNKRGFTALGIDHARNRHKVKAPCAKVDLSAEGGHSVIRDMYLRSQVFFSWLAPPCGTSTLAREIPLTKKQLAAGMFQPLPLRSAEHPWGLPSLSGLDMSAM